MSVSRDIVLAFDHVSKSFDGLSVIRDLSFRVGRGIATALIGPNGAGKTTVFNLVSGVLTPDSGRIFVNGSDVTLTPSRHRIHAGLARSFQNIRLMAHLTVLDNLLVAQHSRAPGIANLLTPFRLIANHRWKREALKALAEAGLEACAYASVAALPYGVRKRIDVVRATLAGASLLLLDEPAAGLNLSETNALRQHLQTLVARGVTLVIVEHDMNFVDSICEHVVALNFGEKIAEGAFSNVRRQAAVREAYLGMEEKV